jgi:hypothetical protein
MRLSAIASLILAAIVLVVGHLRFGESVSILAIGGSAALVALTAVAITPLTWGREERRLGRAKKAALAALPDRFGW